MALAAGPAGLTVGFEPGPESWRFLTANVEKWTDFDLSPIALVRKGASDRTGTARLYPAIDRGGFALEDDPPGLPRPRREGASATEIEVTTLDAFMPGNAEIGLLKIDVEGHELQVLKGAATLLQQNRIRDILFEDFCPQPSLVTLYLQAAGYTVFRLAPAWLRPALLEAMDYPEPSADVPNFLATRDPERARSRFRSFGWKSLGVRARLKRPAPSG
jgi:FkbM family methyltransferase